MENFQDHGFLSSSHHSRLLVLNKCGLVWVFVCGFLPLKEPLVLLTKSS